MADARQVSLIGGQRRLQQWPHHTSTIRRIWILPANTANKPELVLFVWCGRWVPCTVHTHTHGTYSNTISLIYVIDSIGTACRKWEIYTRLYIARMQQSHTPPREKNPCAHFIYSFSCAKLTNARCVFVDKVRHLEEPIMVQYERETRFMFHFCFRFYLCLHRWVSCNSLIC